MKRRIVTFLILILVMLLTIGVFFACDDTTTEEDVSNRTLKSISVRGVNDDNPIVLIKGVDVFNPADYTLDIVFDNDSKMSIPVNNGMFRNSAELALVNQIGTHSLTLTYTFNNTEKSILIDVIVKEAEVVLPKFDVAFDMGEGISYVEQIRTKNISSISTPQISYTDTAMSYMTPEWYTTSTFASASKITFPYTVEKDMTIYAKWVDNRRITVEYCVTRINDGNVVNASGDVTERKDLPSEKSLTVTNLKLLDAETSTVVSDFVNLPTTPSTNVAGYGFSSKWEVYDYSTNTYEVLTLSSLGGVLDFYLTEKYIEDKSALNSTIRIYCIYDINKYSIIFKDADCVYSLSKVEDLTVANGQLTTLSGQYRIDEFSNVVADNSLYHIIGTDVYEMTAYNTAVFSSTETGSKVVVDGTTYYIRKGNIYLEQEYTTLLADNIILESSVPKYYIHTPYLERPHNFALTPETMPYILDKVDMIGVWQIDSSNIPSIYYVRGDIQITANYSVKTYTVTFQYFDGTKSVITKNHGDILDLADFSLSNIKLSTQSGYAFKWDDGANDYESNAEIIAANIAVTSNLIFTEIRTAKTYTNVFKYGTTDDYIIESITNNFADEISQPTIDKIKQQVPQFNQSYYDFEWYRDESCTTGQLYSTDTQSDSNLTLYLKVIDNRKLNITFVVEKAYSKTNEEVTATHQLNIGDIYPIIVEVLGLEYKAEYVEDAANYNIGGISTTSTISFDDSFITTFSGKLDYDEATFTYSARLILTAKMREYNVYFVDTMDSTQSFERVFVHGEQIEAVNDDGDVYETMPRTKDGIVYNFAGWYSQSSWSDSIEYFSSFPTAEGVVTYYAIWRSEADGSFGIVYEALNVDESNNPTSYVMTAYKGHTPDVYVASTYNSKPVTKIANTAFDIGIENIELSITTIYIPSSITEIEEGAFVDCFELQNIYVSASSANFTAIDGVLYRINTSTDYTLFAYPSGKTDASYTVNEHTKSIAADALSSYQGTSIALRDVISIGDRAFKESQLTSILLPATLTSIGREAFSNSANLEVSLENSMTAIAKVGEDAFLGTKWYNDNNADTIMLGNVLIKYLGNAESYTIEEGVYTIADKAFANRSNLKTLTINSTQLTMDNIGELVFTQTTSLKTVNDNTGVFTAATVEDYNRIFADSAYKQPTA